MKSDKHECEHFKMDDVYPYQCECGDVSLVCGFGGPDVDYVPKEKYLLVKDYLVRIDEYFTVYKQGIISDKDSFLDKISEIVTKGLSEL